jgi:uncharacterized membrane protein
MRLAPIAIALLLTACGRGEDAPEAANETRALPANAAASAGSEGSAENGAAAGWDLQSSGEGVALALVAGGARTTIRFFCPARGKSLIVNVPVFRPIGSEERLSFGSNGAVTALVADTKGDRQRGGVSGIGPVPENLPTLIAGPVSASYGAQRSGPHPVPPRSLADAFASACRGSPSDAPAPAPPPPPPTGTAGACLMQGEERLQVRPLRAVGTEPFWGARIDGRCVTYSHPEDQAGTRVWTRYSAGANGSGTWSGALGGRPFVLRARPQPDCSDGMSDRRYPIAVALTVGGEERTGCAEPL